MSSKVYLTFNWLGVAHSKHSCVPHPLVLDIEANFEYLRNILCKSLKYFQEELPLHKQMETAIGRSSKIVQKIILGGEKK